MSSSWVIWRNTGIYFNVFSVLQKGIIYLYMATPALAWTSKPTMIALWIACRGSIACALWMVVTWFDTDDRMHSISCLYIPASSIITIYIFIDPLRLKLITHPCQQHFVLICKQPHVLYWDQSQNWSLGQVGWDVGSGELQDWLPILPPGNNIVTV